MDITKIIIHNSQIYAIDSIGKNLWVFNANNIRYQWVLLDDDNWQDITNGDSHFIGLKQNGTLWGFGENNYGQLGLGHTNKIENLTMLSSAPITTKWSRVSCGGNSTCLIDTQGNGYVCGENKYGQFGTDNFVNLSTPTQIGSYKMQYASISNRNLIFIDDNNTLYGSGNYWGLGASPASAITSISSPVQMQSCMGISQISNGVNGNMYYNMNAIVDHRILSWGTYPQFFNTEYSYNETIDYQNGSDWDYVSSVGNGALAVKTNGTLWGCGFNDWGQLGTGDATTRNLMTQIGLLSDWTQISGEYKNAGAVKSNGTLWVWGNNANGQLGLGDIRNRSSPTQVGTSSDWSSLTFGVRTTAYIKNDNTLWMCGYNTTGELGLSDIIYRSSPVQVGGLSDWSKIRCGYFHSVSIKTDNTLWSWGYCYYGQLGVSNNANRSSPVQVGALSDWSKVACGSYHTIAIKTNNTLWSWGQNTYGQSGLGNVVHRSSPTQVGTLSDWSDIAGGDRCSFFLKNTGDLWASGTNTAGVLSNTVSTNTFIELKKNVKHAETANGNTMHYTYDDELFFCGNNVYTVVGSKSLVPVSRGILRNLEFELTPTLAVQKRL